VSEPSLPEKIVALDRALDLAKIAHAFGGALALAYYAEPRATDDIDLNLFIAPTAFATVADALAPLGVETDVERSALERHGQCRLRWGRTPLDLFFAYDALHEAMRREARSLPFGEDRLPVLGPEHLVVCKAVFDRPKDWLDIEQVLICVEGLATEEIETWLDRILGADDPRTRRFLRLLDEPTAG
jgi:hypothetical protein